LILDVTTEFRHVKIVDIPWFNSMNFSPCTGVKLKTSSFGIISIFVLSSISLLASLAVKDAKMAQNIHL